MIPILYNKAETDFTHNGLGYLTDIIKATVPEERNGAYELSFQYPITGERYSLITEGAIVKCKLDDSRGNQLFRIYKSSKPLKGVVTFSAEHISYDLNGLPLTGFSCTGVTPTVAIERALNTFDDTAFEHNFTVSSDITTLNGTTIKEPCSVRGLLGGREGSILDVWGGEYEFDNYEIILHEHRGADNGVTIEYGKNLTDLKQEININDCYTHIMPYAVYTRDDGNGDTEEVYVYLTEKTIALQNAPSLGHYRAFLYDCSGEFADDEVPTEAKIRIFANRYATANDLVTPKINIKVSFVNLADTLEYKNIAPLERVRLCDTVAVKFAALGITAKAKVIKTVYDVLNEKYESVTIGDAKSSFADTVNKQSGDITRINSRISENRSRAAIELENAIARATAAITGQSGGYVVLNPSENPQEILILDAESGGDIEQAVNVWRWNSGGLGFSSSGYDGTYTTAITMDGEIVADFIAAGTLNGELLQAGSVKADAIAQAFKQTISDSITGAANTVRQEFAAADGQLQSSITNITKTNGTIDTKIDAALSDYSTTAEITTILTDYSTISQTASEIATVVGRINEIIQSDGTVGTGLSTILSDYSTITQTATAISTAVSSKVDNSEIGTKIEQNASSVKIAWNNISKYVQFEAGELRIYDSAVVATQKLRSKFTSEGALFYRDDYYVGKIGTNQWQSNNSYKGLVFDLEPQGKYMAFAQKASASDNAYTTMLCFSRANSAYSDYGLHLGCDFNAHYYTIKNIYLDDVNVVYRSANKSSFTGEIPIVTEITANGSGGVNWKTSKLRVSNGIIVGYWYYEQPFFVSASTTSTSKISVTFNESINSSSVVKGDFTVKVNGLARTISSAALKSGNNKIVELTLANPALTASDTITVAYTKGSLKSTDAGSEDAGYAPTFSAKSVKNTLS